MSTQLILGRLPHIPVAPVTRDEQEADDLRMVTQCHQTHPAMSRHRLDVFCAGRRRDRPGVTVSQDHRQARPVGFRFVTRIAEHMQPLVGENQSSPQMLR